MSAHRLTIATHGERFYHITEQVKQILAALRQQKPGESGLLHLFLPHTSCALAINEAFEDSALHDMEAFLQHLAPRNLRFITHKTEGPDDAPSHMKSLLLPASLTLMVEQGQLLLGKWQGLFLCEFRDGPKSRDIHVKWVPDQN